MSIEIHQVTKTFGSFVALDGVSLHIPHGELTALLGPSGSGKTTLLRIIAGLESPDRGTILFDGTDATDRHVRDRGVGFVFQHYALFRHMTVFRNVAFGLNVRPRKTRPSRSEIEDRVMKLLRLVQLDSFAHRYPSQLSGGQRQRVALARALAVEPQVLLLDEPFGALDAKVRTELRRWLRRLHEEIHVTSVFVTHDQEEALEVADRVVVMSHGRIEQVGTPEDVYHHPANPFVFQFLGNVNVLPAHFNGGRPVLVDSDPAAGDTPPSGGSRGRVFVRPHMMDITTAPRGSVHFRARVIQVNAAGSAAKVELVRAGGEPVHVELTHERYRALRVKRGDEVFVIPRDLRVFLDDNGATADRTDLNAE
ncbi:MAG: sulfate ABC transporter ATP-binding protein [Phycisphaerae bacterium]|nr:sulfate ABC transporter ATP-binding protein [Phycisphaerae bacterium]